MDQEATQEEAGISGEGAVDPTGIELGVPANESFHLSK
jgi:hypothetical protein